jgi:uncharacterized protein YoxC
MEGNPLINKAKLLYKRINKTTDLDENKCNDFIEDLNEIKDGLDELGYNWIEDFKDIEEVSGGILGISEEDIQESFEEVERQSERILHKLGIDMDDINSKKETTHPVINVIQQQHQTASASADVDIQFLVQELKEEINKTTPDKSKIKSILQKALSVGGQYAPKILEVILNNLDKIKFGGLF